MEKLELINGNKQPYTIGLPRLVIVAKNINDVALAHVFENTGLNFVRRTWGNYEAQPTSSSQIAALLLTWNVKTRYYDNGTFVNTLFMKFDHHIGYDIDSICLDCCKENHIHTNGLVEGDRLAC